MQNFVYFNPVKILFGQGQIGALTQEIPQGARVMITYGGGSILKNGVMDQVRTALSGFSIVTFGGIEANPTYETLMKAVLLARQEKITFILAVGGGSVIDGTKFIAAAIPFTGEPWDILERHAPITDAVPFGTVLTLPATGSEMNNGAVITRTATTDKLVFQNDLVFPRFSVLDPLTTYSLPPRQIANGIVDAFVHVVEQYLTYPVNAPIQDRFAEGILRTLIEEGPLTLANPNSYEPRANLMWSATMALNGLIGSGVPQDWATHMIGHELTALYGIDHARTLALVLPALLRVQKQEKRAKLLHYARRVWGIDTAQEDAAIDDAIARTSAFFESLGVPTKIKEHGHSCAIDTVLAQLDRHQLTYLGENRTLRLDGVRRILEQI